MSNSYHMLLTIDVEDWFQVENFKECIPLSSWSTCELRVERNTHRLLDLFDEMEMKKTEDRRQNLEDRIQNPVARSQKTEDRSQKREDGTSKNRMQEPGARRQQETDKRSDESCKACLTNSLPRIRATFFVLGWIAERLPTLVREIRARGHEVASHGYQHELCSGQSCQDLEKDLRDSKKLLEDVIGEPVYGYRAPSFSISDDTLKSIEQCGYLYDSSYNSFAMHARYGRVDLSGNGAQGIAILLDQKSTIENRKFYELPISNLTVAGRVFPWGGGGYFRLIPWRIFKKGIRKILSQQGAYLLYLHPWEIDPEQPKVKDAPRSFRFRHYVNLNRAEMKLTKMLHAFSDCRFLTCHGYLREYAQTE